MLQLDNHPLGVKRLKVAISNPPKRKGEGESGKRTSGQAAPSADGTSHIKQARPIKDEGSFVRPQFIPARLKTQEQSESVKFFLVI